MGREGITNAGVVGMALVRRWGLRWCFQWGLVVKFLLATELGCWILRVTTVYGEPEGLFSFLLMWYLIYVGFS